MRKMFLIWIFFLCCYRNANIFKAVLIDLPTNPLHQTSVFWQQVCQPLFLHFSLPDICQTFSSELLVYHLLWGTVNLDISNFLVAFGNIIIAEWSVVSVICFICFARSTLLPVACLVSPFGVAFCSNFFFPSSLHNIFGWYWMFYIVFLL